MHGLARSNVALNRKILAHLAVSEPFTFETLVNEAKKVDLSICFSLILFCGLRELSMLCSN